MHNALLSGILGAVCIVEKWSVTQWHNTNGIKKDRHKIEQITYKKIGNYPLPFHRGFHKIEFLWRKQ